MMEAEMWPKFWRNGRMTDGTKLFNRPTFSINITFSHMAPMVVLIPLSFHRSKSTLSIVFFLVEFSTQVQSNQHYSLYQPHHSFLLFNAVFVNISKLKSTSIYDRHTFTNQSINQLLFSLSHVSF